MQNLYFTLIGEVSIKILILCYPVKVIQLNEEAIMLWHSDVDRHEFIGVEKLVVVVYS